MHLQAEKAAAIAFLHAWCHYVQKQCLSRRQSAFTCKVQSAHLENLVAGQMCDHEPEIPLGLCNACQCWKTVSKSSYESIQTAEI